MLACPARSVECSPFCCTGGELKVNLVEYARTGGFMAAGLAGRTAELEDLAVEMYARGLSTRDIEAAFRDAGGGSVTCS